MAISQNQSTGIEWTQHTWNPMVGCTIHTPGCTNCYAMRQAARIEEMGHSPAYDGTTRIANGNAVWTGKISRASDVQMRKPLKIREPSRIFVNSMSDFFHEGAQDVWRLEALGIMRATPRHSYQILTKRPEEIGPFIERTGVRFTENIWLGVTIERGDFAHRVGTLAAIDAAVRFISFEPLIGPLGSISLKGMHWAIIGGESGPHSRPMQPDWAREARDLCLAQNVAIFFKQWGIASNNPLFWTAPTGWTGARWVAHMDPTGKGGSILDGRPWKEYPPRPATWDSRPVEDGGRGLTGRLL
jgi:protein gp37